MRFGSKERRSVLCLLALTLGVLALLPATAGASGGPVSSALNVPTRNWIVGLRSTPTATTAQFLSGDGSDTVSRIAQQSDAYSITIGEQDRQSDEIARWMQNPAVAYIEPNITYTWQVEPNDTLYSQQNWAATDDLPNAWSIATGQPSTIVAVLDSGVQSDHPDLKGKVLPGYDFFDNKTDTSDTVGHGTAVAGIIAARGNDGIGIAGVAWNVDILPVKVGNADGAPVSVIAQGVYYAVDHGASVINLSLGSDTPSATLEGAIQYAYSHNVVVVAAAGNTPDAASFPASYADTISVGAATNAGDDIASFSSKISRVDLSAPGVSILTTYWDSSDGDTWALVSGTSFATPMVTGTVALMHSVAPNLTVEQIRSILTGTARKTLPADQGGGAGLLDSAAALRQALLPNFANTWAPLDHPVTTGAVQRTWNWGPNAFAVTTEPYAEAQEGQRLVVYFDKARMEITNPYGDSSNVWYVTNGLLVSEMISGRLQLGVQEFQQRQPAQIPVAGDPDDTTGPTYATFAPLAGAAPLPEGSTITQTLARNSTVGNDASKASYGVTATDLVPETNHRVASVFRDYLNSSGTLDNNGQNQNGKLYDPTYYATGYPITEAYWSRVKVGGTVKDVLVQCFERRCLTYTPSNPAAWQVEMANVGQHYYRWRYGEPPVGPAADDPTKLAK
ncbi:MAG TPA: S8 family serine peptidase [Nitrolancea sp.]|nr:S8 family serine peptidase [Nitrolancea sp.]